MTAPGAARPHPHFGNVAAVLVLLEEQAGRFVPMGELATWLCLPTIDVQDLLEPLWADGLVRVKRDGDGYIDAASAAPPEAQGLPEQPAALPPQPLSAPRPPSDQEAARPLPHALEALGRFARDLGPLAPAFATDASPPIPA